LTSWKKFSSIAEYYCQVLMLNNGHLNTLQKKLG
jgi:hypothetical protein